MPFPLRAALVLFVFVSSFVSAAASAEPGASVTPPVSAAGGWQLTRDADGIRAYSRTSEDSKLLAFKGEVTIDASIDRVLSVVLDAQRVGEWIPRIVESTVLRWDRTPWEYIQYTRFDAPWPVQDRVFLSRVVLEIEPASSRTSLRYHDAPGEELPSRPGKQPGIQGYAGGSYYVLEPANEGRATRLLAVSIADPKGAIPAWLINWAGNSWAHDTMSSLRAQVLEGDVDLLPMVQGLYSQPKRPEM